jgi:hypothetical protein
LRKDGWRKGGERRQWRIRKKERERKEKVQTRNIIIIIVLCAQLLTKNSINSPLFLCCMKWQIKIRFSKTTELFIKVLR